MAGWVAQLSLYASGVPYSQMKAGGNKHTHAIWCGPQFPDFVLCAAGDYAKGGESDSYRNEMFLYNLQDHSQTQIFPGPESGAAVGAYWAGAGMNQYCNPDELSLSWDSTRGRAITGPGSIMGADAGYEIGGALPGGAISRFNPMLFHLTGPDQYRFTNPTGNIPSSGAERPFNGAYDAKTDMHYQLGDAGWVNAFPARGFDEGGSWVSWEAKGGDIYQGYFRENGLACAPEGPDHGLYAVDANTSKLYQINLYDQTARVVCTFPRLGGSECVRDEHGNPYTGVTGRGNYVWVAYSPHSRRVYCAVECDWNEPLPHPQYPNYGVPTQQFPTVFYWDFAAQAIGQLPKFTDGTDDGSGGGLRIRGIHAFVFCGPPHNMLMLAGGDNVALDGQHYPCNPYPETRDAGGNVVEIKHSGHVFFYREDGEAPIPPTPGPTATVTLTQQLVEADVGDVTPGPMRFTLGTQQQDVAVDEAASSVQAVFSGVVAGTYEATAVRMAADGTTPLGEPATTTVTVSAGPITARVAASGGLSGVIG